MRTEGGYFFALLKKRVAVLGEALHHAVQGGGKNLWMRQADSSVAPPLAGLPRNDSLIFFNTPLRRNHCLENKKPFWLWMLRPLKEP
jgi:hypothetical protein